MEGINYFLAPYKTVEGKKELLTEMLCVDFIKFGVALTLNASVEFHVGEKPVEVEGFALTASFDGHETDIMAYAPLISKPSQMNGKLTAHKGLVVFGYHDLFKVNELIR